MNPVKYGRRKIQIRHPGLHKDGLFGMTKQSKSGSIRIDLHQQDEYWSTLWHELLHAFSFADDFELSEKTVVALERAYKKFCRQNPELAVRLAQEIANE